MSAAAATTTTRETAAAEVRTHLDTVTEWQARQIAAEAELESLQDRAGGEVLADESAADRLPKAMQELRDRIDIAARAAAAAAEKLHAARVRVLLLDAEAFDAEAERCRHSLAQHEQTTAELVAALAEHEGRFISVQEASAYQGSPGVTEDHHLLQGAPALKSVGLQQALRRAELRAFVCRTVAAGGDPHDELARERSMVNGKIAGVMLEDLYPASVWGPDAIVAAPAYLRAVAGGRPELPAAISDDGVPVPAAHQPA